MVVDYFHMSFVLASHTIFNRSSKINLIFLKKMSARYTGTLESFMDERLVVLCCAISQQRVGIYLFVV
jgi:hypothetical protein